MDSEKFYNVDCCLQQTVRYSMKELKILILSLAFPLSLPNVIENGDFESDTYEPWECSSAHCVIQDGALGNTFSNELYIRNGLLKL